MINYVDATDDANQRVDYPELVEAFRSMGFEPVGRLRVEPIDETIEEVGAGYGDPR